MADEDQVPRLKEDGVRGHTAKLLAATAGQFPHLALYPPHLGSISTMHRTGLHDALEPLRRARAGAGATMAIHLPLRIACSLQGMPARERAPHRGQACAKAKILLQIAALCFGSAVRPPPP